MKKYQEQIRSAEVEQAISTLEKELARVTAERDECRKSWDSTKSILSQVKRMRENEQIERDAALAKLKIAEEALERVRVEKCPCNEWQCCSYHVGIVCEALEAMRKHLPAKTSTNE